MLPKSMVHLTGQVQDVAAGLVVALLDPQPEENVLDACAAPGGKTLHCAARMQGRVSQDLAVLHFEPPCVFPYALPR